MALVCVCRLFAIVSALVLFAGFALAIELRTDFSKSLVPLGEIISGGPPPDGIPALDRPTFITPKEADQWLGLKEPVLAVSVGDDARAYPLQILIWHEIVNDTVGGRPVAVTYCPLCNSGIVFDRMIRGKVYDFGTSGRLYKSDLVMYDRQTHSLWAQMEGRAIVGDLAGATLAVLPSNTLAYGAWKEFYPHGKVLSKETGVSRRYGQNPYAAYDSPDSLPFLFSGDLDWRLPPKERVVGVRLNGAARAYPFGQLAKRNVVHDSVNGQPVVVFYRPGVLSALDQSEIAASREVGATAVFSPVIDRISLTFEAVEGGFRDRNTGSLWNLLGHAVRGSMAGKRLKPIQHVDAFWFAWVAFNPATSIYEER
jgi:hypothetical protein